MTADRAVLELKEQKNIVDVGGGGGRLLSDQGVLDVNSDLARARADVAEAKARLDRIKREVNGGRQKEHNISRISESLLVLGISGAPRIEGPSVISLLDLARDLRTIRVAPVPQQFACSNWRLPDAPRESFLAHPVLHRQHTGLVLLALGFVTGLGCARGERRRLAPDY